MLNDWEYDTDEDYYNAVEAWELKQEWYADHADLFTDAERDSRQ